MSTFAYLRISTDKQDERSQRLRLSDLAKKRNLTIDEFVTDTASGGIAWQKRELQYLLDKSARGDWLFVTEISRIARSMVGILSFLEAAANKGLQVYCAGPEIVLDDSMSAQLLCFVFGMSAQIDRHLIRSRTLAALKERVAAGVILGRPKGSTRASKLDAHADAIHKMVAARISHAGIGRAIGFHRITVGKWIAQDSQLSQLSLILPTKPAAVAASKKGK
jgi:DNA invertase Pin-like site-specific DNA recombinase